MPESSARRRYPDSVHDRAVQMVFDEIEQSGDRSGAISLVARELDIGPRSLRRWVSRAEVLRQSRARRVLVAAANVLFDGAVELPRIKGMSLLAKVLLLAAGVTVVAGMVLLVTAPGVFARPTWEVGACEIDALAGLLFGSWLVLNASRDYLLGVPGCAVSSFLAFMLATFAGLTLYITGFAQATTFGVSVSAGRQHVAVALALAGVLAAFALMATPWSPYREVAQPCLTAIAVLSPALALATLSGARAFHGGFGNLPVLNGDPILVVASVAGLLAIPLVVANSIEWVSGCVGAGFRLAKVLASRPAWIRVIVSAELLWLGLGSFGWLPGWLGGQLSAWPLVRGAHPDAWFLAAVLTALAALFVGRVHGRLDLEETTSASYIPTTLLFYSSIAGGLLILFIGVRLVVEETVPAAVPVMLVSIGVFALSVASLWFAPGRRRHLMKVIIAVGACGAAVVVAGFLWPTEAIPNRITVPLPQGLATMGTVLDSALILAIAAALTGLICLGAWGISVVGAKLTKATNFDGSPARWTGYETVVLPLGCWSLVLAAAAVLRVRGGLTVSAFIDPVLPDPVLFTVVAVPIAAAVSLARRHVTQAIADAALSVVLVMPVIAFLPFAVPAALGPAGRLAVLAVAAPIIYGVTVGGRDLNRNSGTERRLGWLAGTSAIVVPLLAYLAVVGGQRGSLTSLLIDNGQTMATGLGAHLRLVLLLPLFVTFVSAKPTPFAELGSGPVPSRLQAFQADMFALSVRDKDLDDVYLDRLRRHLAAASPGERARYAYQLAKRLSRSYSPPPPRQPVRPQRKGPGPDYPQPGAIRIALDVARHQLYGKKPPPRELAAARSLVACNLSPPAPEDRSGLRAYDTIEALRCALNGDNTPAACLDALITASRHEIEDSAEKLIKGPHAGQKYERNVARTRKEIGAQLSSIEGPFTIFELPVKFLWLAPAMVLNRPSGVRQGVEMPDGHPYLYIGTLLAALAVVAAILYLLIP